MENASLPYRNELALLNEFARLLLEADSESEVAWTIVKQAIAHLDFEDCVVYLNNPEKNELIQTAAFGPKNPAYFDILNPIKIEVGTGIVGTAASLQQVQKVNDVSLDDRYIVDDLARSSELAIPMLFKGECLGVVDSEHSSTHFFTDRHCQILSTVTDLAAARIAHIRGLDALKKTQKAFQDLVETASDTLFRINLKGRFTYVNPVAVKLTGYSERELLKMHFFDLVESNYQKKVSRFYIDQFQNERESTYLEFGIKDKDGKSKWVGQNLQLVREDGLITGFQAISRDITVLKLAQKAVSRSEESKRSIINAALDSVISIDSNGNVVEFNPAAERTFGFTLEEVIGVSLSELIIPVEHREAHKAGMQRLLKTGRTRLIGKRIEINALHKDGYEFPIELALTQVSGDNGIHFTAFARDITEQKAAQAAIQEAKIIAEENAEHQTRFLASMSHEIRTPLNAVIGISHLLSKTKLTDKQRRYVRDVGRSSDILLGLIDNILDFQKMEGGFLELEEVEFNLHDLLYEIIDRAKYLAAEKELNIKLQIDQAVPEWIKSDPIRITQILSNLLNNSVKFTPSGSVHVRTHCIPTEDGVTNLTFEVHDTGIGISENSKDKIFSSFTQASSDTTRRFGGSGLGLPIVRELVTAFDGSLSFESTLGVGSQFFITIPVKVVSSQQLKAIPANDQDYKLEGIRILVVEDNPVNQFVAKEILESWSAVVVLASGGKEALDILRAESFDIVLMDIQMPDMDGFETTNRIRIELGIQEDRLPIIALTASALREQKERAFEAGMNDFVMKPFDPGFLHSRIAKFVNTNGRDNSEAKSILNWEEFEQNYGSNPELKQKIIAILLEQVPQNIGSIQDSLGHSDPEGLRFTAHKMLTSAKMIGAARITDICIHILDLESESLKSELDSTATKLVEYLEELHLELASE